MQQCVANIRCADNPTFPRQNDNVSKLAIESESERIQLALSLMQRGVVHREPGAGGRAPGAGTCTILCICRSLPRMCATIFCPYLDTLRSIATPNDRFVYLIRVTVLISTLMSLFKQGVGLRVRLYRLYHFFCFKIVTLSQNF